VSLEEAVLYLRELNVALGGVAFFWLLFKANRYWGDYPLPFKAYTMSLMMYSFAAVYVMLEAIAGRDEPGLKSVFVLLANLSLLLALWMTRGTRISGERVR
jgi:hypothetical protein